MTLADHPDWLTSTPPAQRWLLTRERQGRVVGALPKGRTALLNAKGGVGKTMALIQLAISITTGRSWFETFNVAAPGHVCLALAEEESDEARRRIWRVANALGLTGAERALVAERLHVLPLAGVAVALTTFCERGGVEPTEAVSELREALSARSVDWAAVIFDPLSRWAGGGVETDNEAATRFSQVVESFATVPGNPTIVVAHHSSKTSSKEGEPDARGVTGIHDGFRWQASMRPVTAESGLDGVVLRHTKSNYSGLFGEVVLVRNDGPDTEGTLRLATAAEADELLPKPSKSGDRGRDRVKGRVLADAVAVAVLLQERPGLGVRELRDLAKVSAGLGQDRVGTALTLLGAAVRRSKGAHNKVPLTLDVGMLPDELRDALTPAAE